MSVTTVNLSDQMAAFVQKVNTISTNMGDVDALTTRRDSDVVSAINGLDSDMFAGMSLQSLATTNKTIIGAINELSDNVDSNSTSLATLTGDQVTTARGAVSASGDLSYNQSTGVFSIDVEQVYTKANFDSDLGDASTSDLPEGTNLYYTNERVDDRVNGLLQEGTGITLTYDDTAGTLTIAGSAQYGDADARSAISVTASTGLSYNSSTGVIAGVNATTNAKGVASFSSTNFSTSNGAVSIKNDGIARANLKDEVALIIYNSSGVAVKTLYGAGS